MTPQETAKAILKLYDGKPERWTKGAFARDNHGRPPDDEYGEDLGPDDESCAYSPDAVCWCLEGACLSLRAEGDPVMVLRNEAARLGLIPEPYVGLYDWNDAPERTFAEVVALLERIAAEPTP